MASTEMKVIVLALLLLGVGFVYTYIGEKRELIGAAVYREPTDEGYREHVKKPIESDTAPSQQEAPIRVQPSGALSQQDQFLLAMAKDADTDPSSVCTPKKLGPLYTDEIRQQCVQTMEQLNELKQQADDVVNY